MINNNSNKKKILNTIAEIEKIDLNTATVGQMFAFSIGREKINAAQVGLIDELERRLKDKVYRKDK